MERTGDQNIHGVGSFFRHFCESFLTRIPGVAIRSVTFVFVNFRAVVCWRFRLVSIVLSSAELFIPTYGKTGHAFDWCLTIRVPNTLHGMSIFTKPTGHWHCSQITILFYTIRFIQREKVNRNSTTEVYGWWKGWWMSFNIKFSCWVHIGDGHWNSHFLQKALQLADLILWEIEFINRLHL